MNAEFVKALVKVQAELPAVKKSATNPHFKSKFAPLDEVNPAALAVLTKHGFAWVTLPCVLADGAPGLSYRLMHTCGEEIAGEMALMLKAQGPQEQGSAITYARRYSIQAVLGLVTDEDDDGNSAARPKQQRVTAVPSANPTPKQQLWEFAKSVGMSAEKLGSEFSSWSGADGKPLNQATETQVLDFLSILQADISVAS